MKAPKIPVRIGLSRIHGFGLFAATAIPHGTRILQYRGERISKAEGYWRLAHGNIYIFHLNRRSDIDGKALQNTARYINHSCEPNCVVENTGRTIWIMAARDIQADEELTYNYGFEFDEYAVQRCTCGAQNCCSYILARQYRDLLKPKTQ